MLVNFNRIWVLHISLFWYYTSYNAGAIYTSSGDRSPKPAMQWSAVALGGAVSSLIMLLATLAEFSYVPTTWNNTSHLTRRLLFLLVILALTGGPTIYIAFVDRTSTVSLIIGIAQFVVSVIATLLFSIVPSGRMFGDRVAGKARKYLANQTFTAAYPALTGGPRAASVGLWLLIFACKFVESYFFLTLSFKNPIQVMVGMKVQGCQDKVLGTGLCTNQAAFALTMMFFVSSIYHYLLQFLLEVFDLMS